MQKVILVTGASSDLGGEIVKHLSLQNIVYAGVRDLSKYKKEGNVIPVKLDITNESECKSAIERIINERGRIDVLINNAGYTISGPTLDYSVSDFKNILDTNTIGAFRLIKYVVPHMTSKKSGVIINITSLNGLISLPNFGLYSASKHALEALGVALHYELGGNGIKVVNLAPGAIYSENKKSLKFTHRPAREKFKIFNLLMPMVTKEKVATKIVSLINSSTLSEVLMGADAKIVTLIKRFTPTIFWEGLMNIIWRKK